MTDTQLYFAIGIPSALFALNFIVILWQARGLERAFQTRIDALQQVMLAKFEAVDAKFAAARTNVCCASKECSTPAYVTWRIGTTR